MRWLSKFMGNSNTLECRADAEREEAFRLQKKIDEIEDTIRDKLFKLQFQLLIKLSGDFFDDESETSILDVIKQRRREDVQRRWDARRLERRIARLEQKNENMTNVKTET